MSSHGSGSAGYPPVPPEGNPHEFQSLEHRGIPFAEQLRSWRELDVEPVDPDLADPYTKCRIIVMNGIETESILFSDDLLRADAVDLTAWLARQEPDPGVMTTQVTEPGVDAGVLAQETDRVAFLIGQHMMIRDLFTAVTLSTGEPRVQAFEPLVTLLAVHETAE